MRRCEIIHAAAQIFRQKGYHATSMQNIADAVHLQKASLYYHIESKQEILLCILDQALDLLIEDMLAVTNSRLSPTEKLRQAMHVYIERLTQDADLAAVLLLEHRSLHHARRSSHIERRDRYEAMWRGLILEGVQQGAFAAVDEQVATFALLGVLNWMITWYREDGRLSASELADRFSDIMLNGLSRPERVRST